MAHRDNPKKRTRDDGTDTSTPFLVSKRPKAHKKELGAPPHNSSSSSSSSQSTASSDSEDTSVVEELSERNEKEEEEGSEDQDDSETSSSCSSDSESSASSEPQIVELGKPRRPTITPLLSSLSGSQLLSRIRGFLPQLEAANEELEGERLAGRLPERELENVGDGEEYIEMNLGLGVLEHRREGEDSTSSSESESDDQDKMGERGEETRPPPPSQ